jgi:hypothetical protein
MERKWTAPSCPLTWKTTIDTAGLEPTASAFDVHSAWCKDRSIDFMLPELLFIALQTKAPEPVGDLHGFLLSTSSACSIAWVLAVAPPADLR